MGRANSSSRDCSDRSIDNFRDAAPSSKQTLQRLFQMAVKSAQRPLPQFRLNVRFDGEYLKRISPERTYQVMQTMLSRYFTLHQMRIQAKPALVGRPIFFKVMTTGHIPVKDA